MRNAKAERDRRMGSQGATIDNIAVSAYPPTAESAVIHAESKRGNVRFMPLPRAPRNADWIEGKPGHHTAGPALSNPTLSRGETLGHYRIVAPLGAGGMGEVYRATDTRLGRSVALKVLPARASLDPACHRRLEEEARAASALSHPNVVTVYEIGEAGSTRYIATELVEGETLRDALMSGALPLNRLLDIAVQLADALAAAHDAGVVHRDLTPTNVMVTRSGVVKLLDFGLATCQAAPADDCGSEDVTAELPTHPDEVTGTAGYMSPEQTRGRQVDFRSDQFSLGALLYEMATGRRAFCGKTGIDAICAVLNLEPEPIERVQPGVPPALQWIVARCLAKEPEHRYGSTRELAAELRSLRQRAADTSPAPKGPDGMTIGAALTALVVAISVFLFGGGSPQPRPRLACQR